jgi:hypothetical protein
MRFDVRGRNTRAGPFCNALARAFAERFYLRGRKYGGDKRASGIAANALTLLHRWKALGKANGAGQGKRGRTIIACSARIASDQLQSPKKVFLRGSKKGLTYTVQ